MYQIFTILNVVVGLKVSASMLVPLSSLSDRESPTGNISVIVGWFL